MEDTEKYICECGRRFQSAQSLIGHKGHCKIHLGEDRYNKLLETTRSNISKGNEAKKLKNAEKRSIRIAEEKRLLAQWLSEQHHCENCGKLMTEKYASGRFCSRSCSNSYVGKHLSEESNSKKLDALAKGRKARRKHKDSKICPSCSYELKFKDKEYIKDYVVCPYCNRKMQHIQTSHLKTHNKTIEDLRTDFGIDYPTLSELSHSKRSISSNIIMNRLINEGTHKGWQSRKIKSYPERYWESVLDNLHIKYEREVVINKRHDLEYDAPYNYFLDFLLPGNVDLEIDGKQHNSPDRIESDRLRDELLSNAGYRVYRINGQVIRVRELKT